MKITWHNEKRRIRELIPYVANPRQITDKQAKDLKASLDKFGIADPIVINTDNTIIGGHQRKKILESLMGVDPDFEIDVRVPDRELTIDEARELNVRLNKNMGQWDFDVLANNFELDDLLEWGFERTDLDLDLWMDDPPDDTEPQIDRAEELRELWTVDTGQLWQLGEHRLICGDCTDAEIIERLMQGETAGALITDPPYGIGIVGNNGTAGNFPGTNAPRLKAEPIIGDDKPFDPSHLLGVANIIVLWGGNNFADKLKASSKWLVWDKKDGAFDGSDLGDCELAWTNQQGASRLIHHTWQGMYRKGEGERDARLHPTQKPVALMEWCIDKMGVPDNDIIADFYLGSGTTLIACERLNRKCRAVEISPAYVAVAIQRWVDVTGGVPELIEEV